jgi:hypothetical protein
MTSQSVNSVRGTVDRSGMAHLDLDYFDFTFITFDHLFKLSLRVCPVSSGGISCCRGLKNISSHNSPIPDAQ